MSFNLPFGVRVANNDPVDFDRYTKPTNVERDDLITVGRAYEGLQVYVQDPAGNGSIPPTLYILVVLGIDAPSSVWMNIGGAEASGDLGAVQLSDGSGNLIDVLTTLSDAGWGGSVTDGRFYFGADDGDIPTRGGLIFARGNLPQNFFLNDRFSTINYNFQLHHTFNSSSGGVAINFDKDMDGNNVPAGANLGSINFFGRMENTSGPTITASQALQVRVLQRAELSQAGFGTVPSTMEIFSGDPGEINILNNRVFAFDYDPALNGGSGGGDFIIDKPVAASGSDNIAVIDAQGRLRRSASIETDIGGGGGGGLTNAYTQVTDLSTSVNAVGASLIQFTELSARANVNVTDQGGGTARVNIDVVESQIVHDNLFGFVANEHINHGSVSVLAGTGLTGGGTITVNRTLNLDTSNSRNVDHNTVNINTNVNSGLAGGGSIAASRNLSMAVNNLTFTSIIDPAVDFVPIYDASAAQTRRAAVSTFFGSAAWDGNHISYSASSANGDYGFRLRKDSKGVVHYNGYVRGLLNVSITANVDDKFQPSNVTTTGTSSSVPLNGMVSNGATLSPAVPNQTNSVSTFIEFDSAVGGGTTRLRITFQSGRVQIFSGSYPSIDAF